MTVPVPCVFLISLFLINIISVNSVDVLILPYGARIGENVHLFRS